MSAETKRGQDVSEAFIEQLLEVADQLDDHNGDGALEAAQRLSDISDCPLCDRIADGVVAGVVYTQSISPSGGARRMESVSAEIRELVNGDGDV